MNIEEYKLALKRLALAKLNKYISYDLIYKILNNLLKVPLIPCIHTYLDIASYNGTLYLLCDKYLYQYCLFSRGIDDEYYDKYTQIFKLEKGKYEKFHSNYSMEKTKIITHNNNLYIIAGLVEDMDDKDGVSYIYNHNKDTFKRVCIGNKYISHTVIDNNLYICTENYDMERMYYWGPPTLAIEVERKTNHMIAEITENDEVYGPVYDEYFKKINTEQWHEWNDEKDKKDIIKMLPHHRLVNCGFLTDNREYPGKLFELNNTKYILYYNDICKILINEKGEAKFSDSITQILKNKKYYTSVVHNNLLYIIGGMYYDMEGNYNIEGPTMRQVLKKTKEKFNHKKFEVLCEVDIFDGEKWIKGNPMKTPRAEAKAIVYHGQILVMGGRNYEYWKEHFEDYIDENNKFINNKDSVTEYNKKNNTKMIQYKNWREKDTDKDILRELIDDIIDNNFNVNLNTSEYLDI